MRVWLVALAFLAWSGNGYAASKTIQYVPEPAWVSPRPTPTGTPAPEGAAVQVVYSDNQVRTGPDGDEFFTAYRMKILTSEGLSLGNIATAWSPYSDELRVHALRLIRDGRVVDVLERTKFQVIQRENNLEYAMLDGDLTAALQIPGLEVGDELEFVMSLKRRDPTIGERAQGVLMLPSRGAPGAYRMRLVWPNAKAFRWQASPDMGDLKPADVDGMQVLTYELRDPPTAIVSDDAPLRFNLRRYLQFSGFSSWGEVSNLFWPLYEQAARLAPDSPVKAEAARIAASTSDPAERAAAALALVEERIRYVYVAMGDGNYRPADADETWKRRFGDCKAKTALLLALLRELGVPAEPALVHISGGDPIDVSLPMASAFNHVIIRAQVAGETYWLDGTRTGDTKLALLPEPMWGWALPLRNGAVELERVNADAPLLPYETQVLEVDARAGFDVPAKASASDIIRGDQAIAWKLDLAQMSKADAERALKAYWREQFDWVEPGQTSWRYDEAENLLTLTMAGEGTLEWDSNDRGRWLDLPHAGLAKPKELRRPKEQDATAPWEVGFPDYRRWTTVIRLPDAGPGWKWRYSAADMDEDIGGVTYWRSSYVYDGVLRTMVSIRALQAEITAAEATEANTTRRDFDDHVPRLWAYKPPAEAELNDAVDRLMAEAGRDAGQLADAGGEMAALELYPQALAAYEKALDIDPKAPAAIAGKVRMLDQRYGVDAALRYLGKVKSDDPAVGLLRAQTLLRAGKRGEAIETLRPAIAAKAEDADFLAEAAQVALRAGDRDMALAAAQAAVRLAPDDVTNRQVRAHVYAYAADPKWSEALPDTDAAVRLEPEEPVNRRNRANVYYHLGRIEDGLADIDEVLRVDPIDRTATTIKAKLLRKAGRREEAIAAIDGLVVGEGDSRSLNARCWERALANLQLEGAEADCARAVELAPKSAGIWDSYALVALRRNDLKEALRRYEEALELSPKMPASLYGRGLTKLKMGDEAGGRADIADATALAPTVGVELREAGLTP